MAKKKVKVKKKSSSKKTSKKSVAKKKAAPKKTTPKKKYSIDDPNKPLAKKEKIFAEEYTVLLNGTKAAILAGYAPHSARITASKLLTKPNIQQAVNNAIEERKKRIQLTGDRVLQELCSLAYIDVSQAYEEDGVTLKNIHDMPEDLRRAITGLEVLTTEIGSGEEVIGHTINKKLKIIEKTKAIEMLGKYFKLFTEKHEHAGPGGVPLLPPNINVNFVKVKK